MRILVPAFIIGPLLAAASWIYPEKEAKIYPAYDRLFDVFTQEGVDDLNDALFHLSMAVLKESGNKTAVVSPFSVAMALATVNVGARGRTNKQIGNVAFDLNVKYPTQYVDMDNINVWFKAQLAIFKNYTNGNVKIASAVYALKTIALLEQYQKSLTENYGTKIEKVDFTKAHQLHRLKINRFVNSTTEGNIPEFLKTQQVSSDTQLLAVNAIFMKSNFKQPFSKAQTKKAAFHNEDKTTKQVQMMKDTKSGRYHDAKRFLCASIPLAEFGFELLIFVPRTVTLAELREQFFGDRIWFYIDHYNLKAVPSLHITMPKFSTKGDYSLATLLKKLGIKEMFTEKADFSGISKAKIQINDIIHQAVFDLDEEGVNAAAASTVEAVGPIDCKKDCEKTIVADRPFLFAVTYDDVPLFVGQYYG